MKPPKLTEVFKVREATPDWAASDEKDRRERQGAPSAPRPTGTSAPKPTGQKPPASTSSRNKPDLGSARGKELWVHQAAPSDMSPYNIQKDRIKYDRLPPEPFSKGYARVEDPGKEPGEGWGVFDVGDDGSLQYKKDKWDSSG